MDRNAGPMSSYCRRTVGPWGEVMAANWPLVETSTPGRFTMKPRTSTPIITFRRPRPPSLIQGASDARAGISPGISNRGPQTYPPSQAGHAAAIANVRTRFQVSSQNPARERDHNVASPRARSSATGANRNTLFAGKNNRLIAASSHAPPEVQSPLQGIELQKITNRAKLYQASMATPLAARAPV